MNLTLLNLTKTEQIFLGLGVGPLSVTIFLTIWLLYSHLSYYTVPIAQKAICRIVLMPLVYSISSLLSLCFHEYTIYFNLVRDCYEAYVLYQFFSLLLYYFNAEATSYFPDSDTEDIRLKELSSLSDHENPTEYVIEERTRTETNDPTTTSHYLAKINPIRYPFPFCCCPVATTGGTLFARIRLFVFQYVIVKPLTALIAIILHTQGVYHPGSFDYRYGYFWVTLVMNLSIFIAFYYLIVFYQLTHHIIKRHRPLLKLLSIKAILFFLFWQSIIIAVIAHMGWIPVIIGKDVEMTVSALDNVIISCQMMILAFVNLFAFSNYEYKIQFTYTTLDPSASIEEESGSISFGDRHSRDSSNSSDTESRSDSSSSSKNSDSNSRRNSKTKRKKTTKKLKNLATDVLNPIDLFKDGKAILKGKDTKVQ